MAQSNKFYKNNDDDKIWWVDNSDMVGVWEFSFDQKKIYNMFADYPHNMRPDEVDIFNLENPYWKDFFSDRLGGYYGK